MYIKMLKKEKKTLCRLLSMCGSTTNKTNKQLYLLSFHQINAHEAPSVFYTFLFCFFNCNHHEIEANNRFHPKYHTCKCCTSSMVVGTAADKRYMFRDFPLFVQNESEMKTKPCVSS